MAPESEISHIDLRTALKAELSAWTDKRKPPPSSILETLAKKGTKIGPAEADLVIQLLIHVVNRELTWISNWEEAEQGGEFNVYFDIPVPTTPKYDLIGSLLVWAASHGIDHRIQEVYRAMKPGFTFENQNDLIDYFAKQYGVPHRRTS